MQRIESSSESSQNVIDEMEMNTDVCLYLLAHARLPEDGELSMLCSGCLGGRDGFKFCGLPNANFNCSSHYLFTGCPKQLFDV